MVNYATDIGIAGAGGANVPNQLMLPGLSQNIIETALPAQVARQLFFNYPMEGKQAVVIPVEKGSSTIVASRISEGDEIPLDVARITSSTITCYKIGRGTPITREMIMFQQVPIIQQQLRRQGLVMGNTYDYDCVMVMDAAAGTSTACTGKSVGLDMTVGTIAGIGQKDIVDAKARMASHNMFADTLLINPTGWGSLSLLPHYHAEALYGKPVFESGELGNIEGLRVLVSTNVPTGAGYIVNSNKTASALGQYTPMGYFCEALPITSEIRQEPRRDAVEIYSIAMYAPAVVNGLNIEKITY